MTRRGIAEKGEPGCDTSEQQRSRALALGPFAVERLEPFGLWVRVLDPV
jgi:hypothetical protein